MTQRHSSDSEEKSIPKFVSEVFFEKIEDAIDLAELKRAIEEDDGTRYTHEQVLVMLGLEPNTPASTH